MAFGGGTAYRRLRCAPQRAESLSESTSRPTVSDIGRAAGVSLATVDRVLNGRPGVRQSTIDRVHAAIRDIGYVRDVAAANLARGRRYRFAFVLPASESAFVRSIHAAVDATRGTAITDRTAITTVEVAPGDPHAAVGTLRAMDGADVDGVAVLADETPQLRDEITRLRDRGVRVVAIVSDLPSAEPDHFVGIDGVASGRTAGVLMGRFIGGRSGAVVTLANSLQSREAMERRLGFDEVMVARFPALRVLPTVEVRDSARTVRAVLPRLLARGDVVGVYSFGTGHRGLVDVLSEWTAAAPVAIAHDLTADLIGGLRTGIVDAVISQDVDHIVRSAVRVLRAKCDGQSILRSQERIRIEVVLRENLPNA